MTSVNGPAATSVLRAGSGYRLTVPDFVPTNVLFGLGCAGWFAETLADLVEERGAHKILLLTGAPAGTKGWLLAIEDTVSRYDHVTVRNRISNPTIESVGEVLETARRQRVDMVVAVGGGSVLDTGKAIAALASADLTVADALGRKTVSDTPLALLALPTTSGTGSEVTSYATIWDALTNTKHSLSAESMYPDIALVDPELGATMPRAIAAGTGFDALSHAIESCWSINATEQSIEFGLAAIELIVANLERAVLASEDTEARAMVSRGSVYAGFSIAKGQTTIAHAISYPLTARYGVHHGHACGVSVGALLVFNDGIAPEDCQDPRGYAHVRAVIDRIVSAVGATDAADAHDRIRRLMRNVGLPTFDELDGVDIDLLTRDVIGYDRFGNNPRRMSADQLIQFLRELKTPPVTRSGGTRMER